MISLFKNSYFQTARTILFPLKFRNNGIESIYYDSNNEGIIFNYDIPQNANNIVIIIHGWFGSYASPIVRKYATLLKKEYGVIRINLKDHGNTLYLNKSLFSFTEIYYVKELICHIINKYNKCNFVLMGLSLGANILLRISYDDKISDRILSKILITPVFDTESALKEINNKTLFKTIFYKQFKRMLRNKQKEFPVLFDFSLSLQQHDSISMIRYLLPYYGFYSLKDYFENCKIKSEHIENLSHPTLLVLSKNDPIIPFGNMKYLEKDILANKFINFTIQKYGGHCLFYKKVLDFLSTYIEL